MNFNVPLYRLLGRSSCSMLAILGLYSSAVAFAQQVPTPSPASVPVSVSNPADIARAEGIQHPFQQAANCDGAAQTCSLAFALQANRRLIIEYASANCGLSPNADLTAVGITTTVNGQEATHMLAHANQATAGVHLGVAAQVVKIYADAGSTVTMFANDTTPGGTWSCRFSLSGQAVDVP